MDTPAGRRAGRPSLTERRKADTRIEISRTAVGLFAEHGYDATTVERIAEASGMALRTFYRYFRAKEETVAPLLAAGTRDWISRVAAHEPGPPLLDVLCTTYRAAMEHDHGPGPGADEAAGARLREVLRTAQRHPALRAVWLAVHRDAEDALRPVIARRVGADPDGIDARLAAGAANTAVRVAMERWAEGDTPAHDAAGQVADALVRVADGGLLRG